MKKIIINDMNLKEDQIDYSVIRVKALIINDDDRYGIEFNNSLVYVNKSDVESTIEVDSSSEYAESVGVLNYHYTVSSSNENGELDECQQDISKFSKTNK